MHISEEIQLATTSLWLNYEALAENNSLEEKLSAYFTRYAIDDLIRQLVKLAETAESQANSLSYAAADYCRELQYLPETFRNIDYQFGILFKPVSMPNEVAELAPALEAYFDTKTLDEYSDTTRLDGAYMDFLDGSRLIFFTSRTLNLIDTESYVSESYHAHYLGSDHEKINREAFHSIFDEWYRRPLWRAKDYIGEDLQPDTLSSGYYIPLAPEAIETLFWEEMQTH